MAVDNFLSGEPTRSFVEKVDAAHINRVVESLQGSESGDESLSDVSEIRVEGMILKVKN